ncbi:PH domain-containing protein [Clostridium sp.]|jgi:uncharacterized protein|uniref:PH domain-containing protein n=1 Tax=Clostridium sp. TaxID=1506 RepID=UPI003A5B9AD0
MKSNYDKTYYKNIDKNSIKAWIIGRTIGSIIFILICSLIAHFFIIPKFGHIKIVKISTYVILGLIIAMCIVDSYIFPFIEYKQWKYGIFKDKIELIRGIIVKKKTVIPISRIQNLEIKQGPIQRIYGIASVNIITAGITEEIPLITYKEAERLTENLKNVIEIGDRVE